MEMTQETVVRNGSLTWLDIGQVLLFTLPIAALGGILPSHSIQLGNAASLLILAIITAAVLFYSPVVQARTKKRY